jgi:hypothetical protein
MLRLRTKDRDTQLVAQSSRAGVGYLLNRDFSTALRKVQGEPGIARNAHRSDAVREALVALQIASRPDVTKVLLGDAAYSFLYPPGSRKQTNCDVIGILADRRGVILGEGKGKDLFGSLQQISASAKALSCSDVSRSVQSSLVVARPPIYLQCEPGYFSVSNAKGHWKLSEPSLNLQYSAALDEANELGLDPRYDYLVVKEGGSGRLNGLGLAVSKTGDEALYSNRPWFAGELSSDWGPIRKLRMLEANDCSVEVAFVDESV